MSLRIVHLLFIAVSVLLAVFVAGWAGSAYRADRTLLFAAASVGSLAAAAGLTAYGAAFQRRTRGLS